MSPNPLRLTNLVGWAELSLNLNVQISHTKTIMGRHDLGRWLSNPIHVNSCSNSKKKGERWRFKSTAQSGRGKARFAAPEKSEGVRFRLEASQIQFSGTEMADTDEQKQLMQKIAKILGEARASYATHNRKLMELSVLRLKSSSLPPFFSAFSETLIPLFDFQRRLASAERFVRFVSIFVSMRDTTNASACNWVLGAFSEIHRQRENIGYSLGKVFNTVYGNWKWTYT